MVQDKYGQELQIGDVVGMQMIVKEFHGEHVVLQHDVQDGTELLVTCAANQIVKLRPQHLRATSSPDAPLGLQEFK